MPWRPAPPADASVAVAAPTRLARRLIDARPAAPKFLADVRDLPPRSVLFAFDWDGTLGADVEATSKALADMGQAPFVAINTGRTLADLQHAGDGVAKLDRLDAIACCNGTLVFTNDAGLPPGEWLAQLTLDDADAGWAKRTAASSGWHQSDVLARLDDFLSRTTASGIETSRYWSDGVEFNAAPELGTKLADAFVAELEAAGIAAHYEVEHWGKIDTLKIAPAQVHKARPVELWASRLDLRALVTAGDGDNDRSILETDAFSDMHGALVSNLAVVCKNRIPTDEIRDPTRADEEGGLSTALTAALAKQKISTAASS